MRKIDATEAITTVRNHFMNLQSQICLALSDADGEQVFSEEEIQAPNGGLARPRVLANGKYIEKAAVQFTHSVGDALPAAATERNPSLAGLPFQATAISLIVHPQNPYVPTTHMNLRFFLVEADEPVWYFGGGYDLTPVYGFEEDATHWHQSAKSASGPHYPTLKARCDEYFYLPHRQECRGIGGIFFDDWTTDGFDASFSFTQDVGGSFLAAYMPIFENRKQTAFSEREREFQLYRRGRYAEFNLAIDRGTKYGLQSGRRIESVLASLPPLAAWHYNYQPLPGTPEFALTDYFLKPKDWTELPTAVDISGD